MKKQFYGGILNSLAGNDAKFNYEVLDLNVVKNVNYFDGVENQEVPYTNGIVHFVHRGTVPMCSLLKDVKV